MNLDPSTACNRDARLCVSIGPPLMSYFTAPISNTTPLENMSMDRVYELIATDFLQPWTEKIRAGKAEKQKVLPYITPSGTFSKRQLSKLLIYSGIIVIDLDDCDITLKKKLSEDKYLQPTVVFTSPSGNGLKLLITITEAEPENHLNYFNSISLYLSQVHSVEADKSGSDIPRPCFLCYDPAAIYRREGAVKSSSLLKFLPPLVPEAPALQNSSHAAVRTPALSSAGSGSLKDELNRLPMVHQRAVRALLNAGWRQDPRNEDLWVRPGKELKDGISAIYNLSLTEGIWFLTCFTSNGGALKRKGYTDCQLICELEYNSDWHQCITDLAYEYLPLF